MLCRKPYMIGTLACPCGGCLCCRINRRRVWSHRLLLESYMHADSCFVTLTYDEDHCPSELVKSHYRLFLKRLRKAVSPRKLRYFVAGEYGEQSGRPHFHLAIFGLDVVTAGGPDGRSGLVQSRWNMGFSQVGTLTWESAQYIAGYLTKKVVSDESSVREFSRMSLRPGIGFGALESIAKALGTVSGMRYPAATGDVPTALRHGRRLLPLGRYLRRKLRGKMGYASEDTPSYVARLFALQAAADKAEARNEICQAFPLAKSFVVDKIMLDKQYQKIQNLEARFKVHDSQRSLK